MDDFDKLIESLKDPNTHVQTTLVRLGKLPIKHTGLTTKQLIEVFDILLDPYLHLPIAARNHILHKHLYFKGKIPSEIIIKIFGKVGVKTVNNDAKRLPTSFQIQLVTWVISVYSFLEESDIVQRLYGVVFNYLEFDFLRSQMAHLLFLATKKSHVTPRRVEKLKHIYSKYGQPDSVAGLLLHYQTFAPDEVFDTYPRISPRIFTHPDFQYFQELLSLREQDDHSKIVIQNAYDDMKQLGEFEERLKRRKKGSTSIDFGAAFVNPIPSLDRLVEIIGPFNTKTEWSALMFEDRGYSQLAYAVKEDENDRQRLNSWFFSFIDDMDIVSDAEINWAFDAIKNYVEVTGVVPSVLIDEFLLKESNLKNLKLKKYTFFFISRLNIKNELKVKDIFSSLTHVGKQLSVGCAADFIDSLRILILGWYNQIESLDKENSVNTHFKDIVSQFEPLIHYFQYNKIMIHSVLEFINILQIIPQKYLTAQLVVLPESLIHSLLFLGDPLTFSSICGHLNFSKTVLRVAEVNDDITRLTNLHNSYVVDICNLIWRNKAFEISKNENTAFGLSYEFINALENSVPIYDINSGFKSLFNVHANPAFALYSMSTIKKLEQQKAVKVIHEGPLTAQSVEQVTADNDGEWIGSYEDVRLEVLKELEAIGFVGLSELLFSHLKSLVKKK